MGGLAGVIRGLAVAACAAALAGCVSLGPRFGIRADRGPQVDPDAKPVSGTMRPYQINGRWYRPELDPDYDETGLGSWYGDAFNGRPTATGERFDMHAISAAHKTLPLPSIVEVTNLDNGRSLRLRVNDRGPFVDGRIIDLSRAAAQELGYLERGVARVRVRYLGPAGPLDGSRPAARQTYAQAAPQPPAQVQPRPAEQRDYLVQAGAFSVLQNAEAARDRLAAAGEVRILPSDVGGRRLFRVVLGPWPDLNQAELARTRVAGYGFPDAAILPTT